MKHIKYDFFVVDELFIGVQGSATYAMNPQFQVEVTVPEKDVKEGTLIVALMQRLDRKYLKDTGSQCNYIGYAIFQVFKYEQ